jgi:hypothetical protein
MRPAAQRATEGDMADPTKLVITGHRTKLRRLLYAVEQHCGQDIPAAMEHRGFRWRGVR